MRKPIHRLRNLNKTTVKLDKVWLTDLLRTDKEIRLRVQAGLPKDVEMVSVTIDEKDMLVLTFETKAEVDEETKVMFQPL